jgi:hypothetical protein
VLERQADGSWHVTALTEDNTLVFAAMGLEIPVSDLDQHIVFPGPAVSFP